MVSGNFRQYWDKKNHNFVKIVSLQPILIVEDDRELNQGLSYALEKEIKGIRKMFMMMDF